MIKWKRPKHKHAYPWESSPVGNLCAVLQEQFNTVDEKKKEVKWMWMITYNDGHVGCPSWGYTYSIEEAKKQAGIWLRGHGNSMRHQKELVELLGNAKKYGWESWMSGRLAHICWGAGIDIPKDL